MKNLIIVCTFLLSTTLIAQKKESFLLLNAWLHVGNGEVLESAAIGVRGDKISMVKNSLTYTYKREDWDTIIDLMGQHVYPAFVAPNSTLGLTEIDAVRATRDYDEVGQYNPHVRSQIAFNVESKVVSTVKTNGVLLTQSTPRGGRISGTSAIMALDGWNWEDATVLKDDGIHVNWPASIDGGGWWAEPSQKKFNEKYLSEKKDLYVFFEMAAAYAKGKKSDSIDLRLESMRSCFDGQKRVYFHADEIQQLQDVIEFASYFKLPFPVIVGGYDSHLVARKLKDAKIPVMLLRPHSLPENEDDPIDLPYRLPALLNKEGVEFCIQNQGDMEAMNARNLPFLAGTAWAYGLSEEEAVKSISLNTCKIVGIDKQFGSIEEGKSATFFVSEGNALDIRTNNVTFIMIRGQVSSTDNFQRDLYEKYQSKYDKK